MLNTKEHRKDKTTLIIPINHDSKIIGTVELKCSNYSDDLHYSLDIPSVNYKIEKHEANIQNEIFDQTIDILQS